jgi:hypothetical protein
MIRSDDTAQVGAFPFRISDFEDSNLFRVGKIGFRILSLAPGDREKDGQGRVAGVSRHIIRP